jgi:hypothetical protein
MIGVRDAPLRSDKLEAAVWREVAAVLDDPLRVTAGFCCSFLKQVQQDRIRAW